MPRRKAPRTMTQMNSIPKALKERTRLENQITRARDLRSEHSRTKFATEQRIRALENERVEAYTRKARGDRTAQKDAERIEGEINDARRSIESIGAEIQGAQRAEDRATHELGQLLGTELPMFVEEAEADTQEAIDKWEALERAYIAAFEAWDRAAMKWGPLRSAVYTMYKLRCEQAGFHRPDAELMYASIVPPWPLPRPDEAFASTLVRVHRHFSLKARVLTRMTRMRTMRTEKQILTCPVCGHARADMTRIPGRERPLLGCWSCEAGGLRSGDWLRAVAQEVGAPGGGALLDEPEHWLAPYVINGSPRRGPPTEPPSLSMVCGWHSALKCHKPAMQYLMHDRRLSIRTLSGRKLGYALAPGKFYEWPAITIPVFAAPNEVINLRKRFWPDVPVEDGKPVKYVGLRDRGSHLYPSLPSQRVKGLDALLVAGEFDALIARQKGLPAVSTTCGASLPRGLVRPLAQYDNVAVLFDVGEEPAAETPLTSYVRQERTPGPLICR